MNTCADCTNFYYNEHSKRDDCNFSDIGREVSMNACIHLEEAEYEVIRWLRESETENQCPVFKMK